MDGLKPCPFCGSEQVRLEKEDVEPMDAPEPISIEKIYCPFCAYTMYPGANDPVIWWNDRPREDQCKQALETIASGELPDGDCPSQPVQMFAEEILEAVEDD